MVKKNRLGGGYKSYFIKDNSIFASLAKIVNRSNSAKSAKLSPTSLNGFSLQLVRGSAVGLFSLLIAFVAASTFAPVQNSDATDVSIENTITGYNLKITSADSLPISVEASPSGQLAGAKDTITIATNSPTGYKLYVSTSSNDNNIYKDGSSSNSSLGYFSPTTGTITSPTQLSQNTWGFALDKTNSSSNSSAFADLANYNTNASLTPLANATYAAVPTYANSSSAEISTLATTNSPDGTSFDIYYGINASTTLPTGTYNTTVTYTAVSEGVNSFESMQDFTAEECYNLSTDQSINLTDSRDGKYYRITKMADGHCWMADNLALDGTDKSGNVRTLTPSDSNVTTNRQLAENITNGTASAYDVVQIYSGNADSTTTDCGSYAYCITSDVKYGNLYNWNAATAGVGKQATTGTVTESICPKGWRLPDSTGSFSYVNLMGAYNLPTDNGGDAAHQAAVKTVQQAPLYFSLAGIYGNSSVSQGLNAYYWSRTAHSSTNLAYFLGLYAEGGGFLPQDSNGKYYGFSVRCVFSGQPDDTMQTFTTTLCNTLATDSSKVLIDRRDGSFYHVVHAKDGNCWMADNLKIYNTTISAEDSDFTSGTYTIPAGITQESEWASNIYNKPMVEVAHGLGRYANTTDAATYAGQVYYNWCAATATTSTACATTTPPNTSICPKGWQLPVNGDENTDKTWARLFSNTYGYNITTGKQLLANDTLGFRLYYGYWNLDYYSEYGQGADGYFWSGTPSSEAIAYRLSYWASGIYPQNNTYKSVGFSVRCVLR